MPESVSYYLYTLEEIFDVPTTAGIYAWVLKRSFAPRLAKPEYETELRTSLGAMERFSHDEAVRLYASEKTFGASWQADFHLSSQEWKSELFSPVNDSHARDSMSHLGTSLAALAPILYVGKANNLRSRLEQHRSALNMVNEWEQVDLEKDGRNFAQRVRQLAIPHELLRFTFFEHPVQSDMDQDEVRRSNERVEMIINRILKPRLGRR